MYIRTIHYMSVSLIIVMLQMPFSREELDLEMERKKNWGIIGGVIVFPMILPDTSPQFKQKFLYLFRDI